MNKLKENVRLFNLNEFNYPKFRAKLVDLYLHSFTTGEYAQYIDFESIESTLDDMLLHKGDGVMAFIYDRLVGLLIATPLKNDNEFPQNKYPALKIDHTIYIAEVMVHIDTRERGIASKMILERLSKASSQYTDVVIRVWDKNLPALHLYEKLGFKPIATILQRKLTPSHEMFEMNKIYLHRKLTL